MVWGQQATRGVDDLVARLSANDAKLTSLTILKQRRLGHEDVEALCNALSENTCLTELYASNHAMEPRTAALFSQLLAQDSCGLKALCIGSSILGDAGVAALVEGLASNTTLTRLDLDQKSVGPAGAEALSRCLAANTTLATLTLNNNETLGDAGLAALCSCSTGPWNGLKVLELQGCSISGHALTALAAMAAGSRGSEGSGDGSKGGIRMCRLPALTTLRLRDNALGGGAGAGSSGSTGEAGDVPGSSSGGDDEAAAAVVGHALGQLIACAPALQELSLAGCQLGDAGLKAMADALQEELSRHSGGSNTSSSGTGTTTSGCGSSTSGGGADVALRMLDLTGCMLTSAGIEGLVALLRCTPRLSCLNLANNTALGDDVVQTLTAAAPASLTSLDLSNTKAGPRSVEQLAKLSGLTHLNLFSCPLGDEGAQVLASSLSASSGSADSASASSSASGSSGFAALQDLSVSACGIGLAAGTALLACLAQGAAPSLQSLEIGANPATEQEDFMEAVAELRGARPALGVHWRSADQQQRHHEAAATQMQAQAAGMQAPVAWH